MFNASILELQSQIHYYQQQIEESEQELDRLKMTEAFAEEAVAKVSEALEHVDEKYISVFKEHLLSMFPIEAPVYLEETEGEDDIEYMNDSHPDYKSIEQIQEEEPDNIAVFHSEEQEEKKEKTYFELTGRPDLRPDTYEDLTPNITYSSSKRAYIGFNDRKEAEEFRDSISAEPAMIEEAVIMNKHKYELKFYCDRQYLEELKEELENDWTPEQKAELDWQEQLVRIAPNIFYDPSSSKCLMGFSNRGRASTYGAHLKEIHELYDSRYTVDKSKVITNCKWELTLENITKENAQKLAKLNLKKDLDYKTNKVITDSWDLLTEDVKPKPLTKEVKPVLVDKVALTENDFPSAPYQEVSLSELELCDVITTSSNVRTYYEVIENKGAYITARCIYSPTFPKRIGEDYTLEKAFLVEKCSQEIATAA